MLEIDVVALALPVACARLEAADRAYEVVKTAPSGSGSRQLQLDEAALYVIRQTVDSKGVYQLVVAAKMAKHGQNTAVSPN
ncbi:hypothetical protein [Azotosporobacter soli]|uniref:hypothetical protein n=1 Tax=Azotosporobacter soli TaxID=3055040 RepID=UPI0031FF023D